jgi:hypothetical protein
MPNLPITREGSLRHGFWTMSFCAPWTVNINMKITTTTLVYASQPLRIVSCTIPREFHATKPEAKSSKIYIPILSTGAIKYDGTSQTAAQEPSGRNKVDEKQACVALKPDIKVPNRSERDHTRLGL